MISVDELMERTADHVRKSVGTIVQVCPYRSRDEQTELLCTALSGRQNDVLTSTRRYWQNARLELKDAQVPLPLHLSEQEQAPTADPNALVGWWVARTEGLAGVIHNAAHLTTEPDPDLDELALELECVGRVMSRIRKRVYGT
jgi:hypothetical protein